MDRYSVFIQKYWWIGRTVVTTQTKNVNTSYWNHMDVISNSQIKDFQVRFIYDPFSGSCRNHARQILKYYPDVVCFENSSLQLCVFSICTKYLFNYFFKCFFPFIFISLWLLFIFRLVGYYIKSLIYFLKWIIQLNDKIIL